MECRMEASGSIAFLHLHRQLSRTRNKWASTGQSLLNRNKEIRGMTLNWLLFCRTTKRILQFTKNQISPCYITNLIVPTMDIAGGVAVKLVLFNARQTDIQKQHSVVFFVKGDKGLHTCTLLNVCNIIAGLCTTPAWRTRSHGQTHCFEWSSFGFVWQTAAAHSETAPVNGDVNWGSKSDERSRVRQSILPSHPVVVFVVDWIVQSL